ncbi:hypothetical protein PPROV_000443000 [Pycnococcus provasolii]|uniref:CBM20 domain-containing protein n=1 Tax=Pycnococcus provasolii TaxID=41880 RepID=A0A830HIN1_9CHLO|nr:hypothetical protein PPROV_000443000 [Pycnococcus provasolii]
MSQVNGVWLTDVALPAGTRVEYKYVAMRDGGDAHWWPGDNLVLTVPEGENLPPRYVACDNLSGRSTRFVAAVDNDHSTGAEVPFSEWIRHGGAAPALAAAAAGGAVLTAAAMSMMQNGPPFSAEHWRTFASLSSVDRPMPTSSARSRLVPPSEMTLGASVVTTVRTRVADASRVVGSEVANLVEQVRRTPDKNTPAYKANEKREERFREGLADLSEDLGYYMRYTTWLAHVSLLHLRFAAMRVAYEAEVAGHSMASAAQSYAYEHAGAWSTNAVEAIALTKEWCVDQATGFGVFVSDWRTAGAMATAAATFAAMGEHVKMLASFLAANPSTAGQLFAVVAGGAVLSLAVRKSLLASRLTHAPAVDAPPSPDASAATTESESREATSATILRDIGRNVQLKLEERIQLLRELVEAKEMTIHSSMQTLIETQEQSEMLRRNLDKTARQRDELSGEVERLKEALLESTAQSSRTSSVSPSSTAYREPMSHALNIDPIVTKRFAELQLRYEERKAKEEEH